jgi:FkbM family methyltransferase
MVRNYKQTVKHWLAVVFGLELVYQTKSFAQEGEDLLIAKLLQGKAQSFYIDVGAHHPLRFSNTYLLYKRGWRGINIDPSPGGMSAFELQRPRDINLELAVGKKSGVLTYFQFADSALNTFDESAAKRVIDAGQSLLIKTSPVELQTLQQVTDTWLPVGQEVALLDIDVEGSELEVLESNDWQRVQPLVIAVEYLGQESTPELQKIPLVQFLASKNYSLRCRTVNTLLFTKSSISY